MRGCAQELNFVPGESSQEIRQDIADFLITHAALVSFTKEVSHKKLDPLEDDNLCCRSSCEGHVNISLRTIV